MAHLYNSQLDAFTLYHKVHDGQTSTSLGPALPALGHALAGSTGAAISNLCIYPLDLIITRLQVQRQLRKSSSIRDEKEYKGVFDAAKHIYYREGGVSALYAGVLQDTGKSVADSFLFFLFYNYLRQRQLQKHATRAASLSVFDEIAVGALAGACSKFFTAPIANIVTRKQTASMIAARSSASNKEPTVKEIVAQIRSEKGIKGFWSGYSASLVLTLNPSLTFFLYETFKRTLLPRAARENPGSRAVFLMAAVSKAIASTITYPFSLAKARAQVGDRPPANPDAASAAKSAATTSNEVALDEQEEKAKKLGKDIRWTAARSTVFSTILHIYGTEGPQALYEGVWGEILKGFFSHGVTMLVKESVHRLIIQLYYLILRTLKRMPTASETGLQAQDFKLTINDKAQEVVSRASETASSAYDNTTKTMNNVGEVASGTYNNATKALNGVVNDINERLISPLKSGRTDAYERAQGMVKQGIEPKFVSPNEPRNASTDARQTNPQVQTPKIDAYERAHVSDGDTLTSIKAIGSESPSKK